MLGRIHPELPNLLHVAPIQSEQLFVVGPANHSAATLPDLDHGHQALPRHQHMRSVSPRRSPHRRSSPTRHRAKPQHSAPLILCATLSPRAPTIFGVRSDKRDIFSPGLLACLREYQVVSVERRIITAAIVFSSTVPTEPYTPEATKRSTANFAQRFRFPKKIQ